MRLEPCPKIASNADEPSHRHARDMQPQTRKRHARDRVEHALKTPKIKLSPLGKVARKREIMLWAPANPPHTCKTPAQSRKSSLVKLVRLNFIQKKFFFGKNRVEFKRLQP